MAKLYITIIRKSEDEATVKTFDFDTFEQAIESMSAMAEGHTRTLKVGEFVVGPKAVINTHNSISIIYNDNDITTFVVTD